MKITINVQELSQVISWINPPRDRPTPDERDLWDEQAYRVAYERNGHAIEAIETMINQVPEQERAMAASVFALRAVHRILLGQ